MKCDPMFKLASRPKLPILWWKKYGDDRRQAPENDRLIRRIVARYCTADEAPEEDAESGDGVSAKWIDWLKEEHASGKEKVPNPNPDSKDTHPQVSYSTALKSKTFKDRAKKEYLKWLERGKGEKSKGEKGKDEKGKSEKDSKDSPLEVSAERLDSIIQEHKAAFDRISGTMTKAVKKYKAEKTKKRNEFDTYPQRFKKAFGALSEQEQAIMAAGQELGKYFQEHLAKRNKSSQDAGKDIGTGWRLAGDMSKSELVQNLLGVAESWGVKGSKLPDEESDNAKKQRDSGAKDKDLQDFAKEAYEFTQAYFKHLGVKEVTLYRGVKGQGVDKAKDGEEVELTTRPLSSFSLNSLTARTFGRCIEFKVPVKDIFMSSLTNPGFEHEAELVVMGGAHKGKVLK